jgi:hypothetical protein
MCMTYHLKYVVYLIVKQIVMPSTLETTYIMSTRIFHSHHSVLRLTNAQPQPKVYIDLYALFYFCDISNFTLIVLFHLNIGTGIYAFKVHSQI